MAFVSCICGASAACFWALIAGLVKEGLTDDQGHGIVKQVHGTTQQQCWHQWFEYRVCKGTVYAPGWWQVESGGGRRRGQGLQIVADDFGVEVLQYGKLRQPGDVLQVVVMLEALEGFLDAPALVVECAEFGGGELCDVE